LTVGREFCQSVENLPNTTKIVRLL